MIKLDEHFEHENILDETEKTNLLRVVSLETTKIQRQRILIFLNVVIIKALAFAFELQY